MGIYMKKSLHMIAVILILSLLMTGCAKNEVSLAPSLSEETNNIGFTQDEWISLVDQRMEKYNYPTLSTAIHSATEVITDKGSVISCERYELIKGIEFYFLEQPTSDLLQQIIFSVDQGKLSAQDYTLLGYLEGSLPFFLEPDAYQELEKRLNLSSVTDTLETTASGEIRQYRFEKKSDIATLYIYPIGKDIISLGLLEFEDNSIVDPKYENGEQFVWTADNFIKEMDTRLSNAALPTLSANGITTVNNNHNVLAASFGATTDCYLFTSQETEELEGVYFICNYEKSESNSLSAWGFALVTSIQVFDHADYESISNDLMIDQVSPGVYRESSGTLMDYTYMVEGSIISCIIWRKSDKPAINTTENNNNLQSSSSSDIESGGTALCHNQNLQ